MLNRFNILITGYGGQGLRTFTSLLSKILLKSGFHVHSFFDFTSKMRGGKNRAIISFSDEEVHLLEEKVDILAVLSDEEDTEDEKLLKENGIVIKDGEKNFDGKILSLPLLKFAKGAGNRIYQNTVLLGAILGIFGIEVVSVNETFLKQFARKGIEVYDENLKAAVMGFKQTFGENYIKPIPATALKDRILVTGMESIIFGAIGAGCQTLYTNPVPATRKALDLMSDFSREFPIITDGTEDDSSAIFKALGSSYTGVKSLVLSTSSSFQNLNDGISFSGMAEIPIVIAVVQTPGPSVGMPTKTEQSNLLYSICTGNMEIPKVIFAPGTQEECYSITHKAFEISSNYNIPVIILLDHYLSESINDIQLINLDEVRRPRDHFTRKELEEIKEYKTYSMTETGISPRLYPGQTNLPVIVTTFEHDEMGKISDSLKNRENMVNKRLRKARSVLDEFTPPEFYGDDKFDILITGWGSTIPTIKVVVDVLRKEKVRVGALLFTQVYPINEKKIKKYFRKNRFFINIESNSTGQMGIVLRSNLGFEFNQEILRYDGFPITFEFIMDRINTEYKVKPTRRGRWKKSKD